jgi:hypothetical protein
MLMQERVHMNERIKLLAEQAGFYNMGIGLIIGIEEYHQKFAELIIRECVELNRQELSFSAFARMLDKYDDHFGVEQ